MLSFITICSLLLWTSISPLGKEIIDLEQSTGPKGSIDLGESTKADSLPHQAMLEVEQVANLESSDLVSAN